MLVHGRGGDYRSNHSAPTRAESARGYVGTRGPCLGQVVSVVVVLEERAGGQRWLAMAPPRARCVEALPSPRARVGGALRRSRVSRTCHGARGGSDGGRASPCGWRLAEWGLHRGQDRAGPWCDAGLAVASALQPSVLAAPPSTLPARARCLRPGQVPRAHRPILPAPRPPPPLSSIEPVRQRAIARRKATIALDQRRGALRRRWWWRVWWRRARVCVCVCVRVCVCALCFFHS